MEFKTPEGRIEIDAERSGSAFTHEGMTIYTGDELWLEIDGRKHKAVATKVGDVWWVHVNGQTMQFEVIEPGASSSDDEGGLTLASLLICHSTFIFIGFASDSSKYSIAYMVSIIPSWILAFGLWLSF